MKQSFIVKKFINPAIKVGDKVRIIDGSGFSIDNFEKEAYIILSYPELFGQNQKVKEIEFEVISINETDRIISTFDTCYLQDLVLKAPNGQLVFNCSSFVKLYTENTMNELVMENYLINYIMNGWMKKLKKLKNTMKMNLINFYNNI